MWGRRAHVQNMVAAINLRLRDRLATGFTRARTGDVEQPASSSSTPTVRTASFWASAFVRPVPITCTTSFWAAPSWAASLCPSVPDAIQNVSTTSRRTVSASAVSQRSALIERAKVICLLVVYFILPSVDMDERAASERWSRALAFRHPRLEMPVHHPGFFKKSVAAPTSASQWPSQNRDSKTEGIFRLVIDGTTPQADCASHPGRQPWASASAA
jgi:hypothetical protein